MSPERSKKRSKHNDVVAARYIINDVMPTLARKVMTVFDVVEWRDPPRRKDLLESPLHGTPSRQVLACRGTWHSGTVNFRGSKDKDGLGRVSSEKMVKIVTLTMEESPSPQPLVAASRMYPPRICGTIRVASTTRIFICSSSAVLAHLMYRTSANTSPREEERHFLVPNSTPHLLNPVKNASS